jgi:hypothetical protein
MGRTSSRGEPTITTHDPGVGSRSHEGVDRDGVTIREHLGSEPGWASPSQLGLWVPSTFEDAWLAQRSYSAANWGHEGDAWKLVPPSPLRHVVTVARGYGTGDRELSCRICMHPSNGGTGLYTYTVAGNGNSLTWSSELFCATK